MRIRLESELLANEKKTKKRVSANLTETLVFAGGADRARTGDIRRDRPAF